MFDRLDNLGSLEETRSSALYFKDGGAEDATKKTLPLSEIATPRSQRTPIAAFHSHRFKNGGKFTEGPTPLGLAAFNLVPARIANDSAKGHFVLYTHRPSEQRRDIGDESDTGAQESGTRSCQELET